MFANSCFRKYEIKLHYQVIKVLILLKKEFHEHFYTLITYRFSITLSDKVKQQFTNDFDRVHGCLGTLRNIGVDT